MLHCRYLSGIVFGGAGMPKPVPVQDNSRWAPSQLFTVRVWCEDLGNGCFEWRGKVQHVTSGEVRYFRDWPALIASMQEMLGYDSDHS